MALVIWVFLGQDYPSPDRKDEVAALDTISDSDRTLRLKVVLELGAGVVSQVGKTDASPHPINSVPGNEWLVARLMVLEEAH